MTPEAGRRLLAEFTGTGLLVAVVVGSGIAAARLTPDDTLRLLINSVATAMGLAVLILVFSPAGGAHFNPLVTGADWILGRRYGIGQAAAVIACQTGGAIAGAALADTMFGQLAGPGQAGGLKEAQMRGQCVRYLLRGLVPAAQGRPPLSCGGP
jgi:glycerol uptake facilitator-like aquaporin